MTLCQTRSRLRGKTGTKDCSGSRTWEKGCNSCRSDGGVLEHLELLWHYSDSFCFVKQKSSMIWKLLSSTLTVSCLILMHINSLQNMKRMINNKSGSPTHLLHNKKNYLKTRTPILLELKSLDQQSLIWWECTNFYSHPRELRQGLSSTARLFSKLLLFTTAP